MIQGQTDKLDFLQKENKNLREQINDLKEIINLNKTQIDILSSQLSGQGQSQKLIDVIYQYRQKQQKLQMKITAMQQEMKALTSQNLIFKQMNDEQSQEIKNIQNLNLASIEVLNQKIKNLEQKIIIYDKNYKEYDKVGGFVLKNRNIVSPAQISVEMKDKEIDMIDQMQLMKAQIELAKKNTENLMIVNTVLRNKIVSLQAKLAMPNRNVGQVLDKSHRRLMMYFLQMQKKIITGDDQSESDEEQDLQLIAPELSGLFPQKQLRAQRDYGVPHLDLLKIRQQIMHSSNKIKQALLARNHLSDKQKIQRLEIQLEYTRRELSKNIIDLRSETSLRKKIQRNLDQVQHRNLLLVRSNQHLQSKVQKYWNRLQTLIAAGNVNSLQEIPNDLQATLMINQPQIVNNVSRNNQLPLYMGPPENGNLLDYKIHLQMMARDLQKNKKLQKIQQLKPIKQEQGQQNSHPRKLARSSSNPFLYFNERRNEIMEVHQEEPNKNQRMRLQQTEYHVFNNSNFHGQDVLDDEDI